MYKVQYVKKGKSLPISARTALGPPVLDTHLVRYRKSLQYATRKREVLHSPDGLTEWIWNSKLSLMHWLYKSEILQN